MNVFAPRWRIVHAVVVCVLTGAMLASGARAQNLPDNLVGQGVRSEADRQAIRDFAAPAINQLKGDDPAEWSRAKARLIGLLDRGAVAVSFRGAYSDTLLPELKSLAEQSSEKRVIALYIAGELATEPAVLFVESARADEDPQIRYASVFSLGRTLRALRGGSPVIAEPRAREIVTSLTQGLSNEDEPLVVDVYVRSLLEGTRLRDAMPGVAEQALRSVASGMGERFRKLQRWDSPEVDTLLTGTAEIRRQILEDFNNTLSNDAVREAAGLAGDMIAAAERFVRTGEMRTVLPQDEAKLRVFKENREKWPTLMRAGSQLLDEAMERFKKGEPVVTNRLAESIEKFNEDGDRDFLVREAPRYISQGGLLVEPPLNFPAQRFRQ